VLRSHTRKIESREGRCCARVPTRIQQSSGDQTLSGRALAMLSQGGAIIHFDSTMLMQPTAGEQPEGGTSQPNDPPRSILCTQCNSDVSELQRILRLQLRDIGFAGLRDIELFYSPLFERHDHSASNGREGDGANVIPPFITANSCTATEFADYMRSETSNGRR
jgi:hypothetical protein